MSVVVNNNSPVAQVLRVTPYLNQATIDVSLPGGESWVGDRTFTMPLPVYTPAGWNIAQVDGIRLVLNTFQNLSTSISLLTQK